MDTGKTYRTPSWGQKGMIIIRPSDPASTWQTFGRPAMDSPAQVVCGDSLSGRIQTPQSFVTLHSSREAGLELLTERAQPEAHRYCF